MFCKSLSHHLAPVCTIAMSPVVVEAQQPEADHKADAEDGICHAEKVTGTGNLLLVLLSLAIIH